MFYNWTYGEWLNRIQGANLAAIDAYESALQVVHANVGMSREKKLKSLDKYFDANKARDQVIHGSKAKEKEADFTIYENLKTSLKQFDWAKHYVPKQDKKKQ